MCCILVVLYIISDCMLCVCIVSNMEIFQEISIVSMVFRLWTFYKWKFPWKFPEISTRKFPKWKFPFLTYDDVTIGQYHIQTTYTCTCIEVHSYVYMRNYSISYTIFVTVRNKRNNMCGEKNCTTATVGGNLLVRTELVVDQCVRRTFHDGGNRRVV